MAVRVMSYLGLLYQDLIRQKFLGPSGKLPPVLPIVLYNGERRWTASQNIGQLIETIPGGLKHYRPELHYLLLDEGAVIDSPGCLQDLLEVHDMLSERIKKWPPSVLKPNTDPVTICDDHGKAPSGRGRALFTPNHQFQP